MKPIHFLPPVLSLAIVGLLLGRQQSSIKRLETETVVLRERIESAGNGGVGSEGQVGKSWLGGGKEAVEEEIDWKSIGDLVAKSEQGGISDVRTFMELQTMLTELSEEELLEELDRIERTDLGADIRQTLEGMLVGLLAQKDPVIVLDRFLDRMHDQRNGMSWQLSSAFGKWQRTDPEAAMNWFNAEIEEGSFEGKSLDGGNDARVRFEGVAISRLLEDDPDAAMKRAAVLTEVQQKRLFQQGTLSAHSESSQKAFAELVRSTLPEGERAMAYRTTVSRLAGNFEKIDGLIANIGASESERDGIVQQAATSRMRTLGNSDRLDRKAVDEMREWAATQSPDQVDAATGKSLANIWGGQANFAERAKIISDLHEEGAGDVLVVTFLENSHQARNAKELSRELAELIADEGKRKELLQKFGGNAGGRQTPQEAIIEE